MYTVTTSGRTQLGTLKCQFLKSKLKDHGTPERKKISNWDAPVNPEPVADDINFQKEDEDSEVPSVVQLNQKNQLLL